MSPTLKKYIGGVLLVAIILWFFIGGRGGDEARIHAMLDELTELVNKTGSESQFQALGNAKKVAGHFVEQPCLELGNGVGALNDKDALMGYVLQFRKVMTTLDVSIGSRNLKVEEGGGRAILDFVGKVDGKYQGGSESNRGRFRMHLSQDTGEWLIEEIRLIE